MYKSLVSKLNTKLIFTSATGRCGTAYLANLINKNVFNASAEHDPKPQGYGMPIIWYDNGEIKKLHSFAKNKLFRLYRGKKNNLLLNNKLMKFLSVNQNKYIRFFYNKFFYNPLSKYYPTTEIKNIYLESSHAFIKSFGQQMCDIVPNIGLIHLIRSPLYVAKSFYNRNSIPGPNNKYLLNPIFKKNIIKPSIKMTKFQKCLWYWFEMEIRHIEFIENNEKIKVFQIITEDLNKKDKIKQLFDFYNFQYNEIKFGVNKNSNTISTKISQKNLSEATKLIDSIPDCIIKKINDKINIDELNLRALSFS